MQDDTEEALGQGIIPVLEVLHVTDCPNLRPMLARLADATDLPVATREVTNDAEAATLGMNGSPTLLVNGIDPFASADHCACGVSCRLYRDQNGRIVPAPSVDQLRHAIAVAAQPGSRVADLRAGRGVE